MFRPKQLSVGSTHDNNFLLAIFPGILHPCGERILVRLPRRPVSQAHSERFFSIVFSFPGQFEALPQFIQASVEEAPTYARTRENNAATATAVVARGSWSLSCSRLRQPARQRPGDPGLGGRQQ